MPEQTDKERIASLEAENRHVKAVVTKLWNDVRGSNGTGDPGLKTRVDRLFQVAKLLRWFLITVGSVVLADVALAVYRFLVYNGHG